MNLYVLGCQLPDVQQQVQKRRAMSLAAAVLGHVKGLCLLHKLDWFNIPKQLVLGQTL